MVKITNGIWLNMDKEMVQKQQRRLIEAFQEVVEDTNGEALKDSPQEA